ncbi:MAG: 30S ribosomal protein S12 methylthiotransferase RimO, partial [Bacillota bacterium]|nr:30S ribosomal protein S12 methylthiotransferase RimO [Bacillota bacterium]
MIAVKNVAIVSLGCPKNLVDSENMAGALAHAGYSLAVEDEADVILINTCGFIEPAKREALSEIVKAIRRKQSNPGLRIVVTGCLAQRYHDVLSREFPEVDAIAGVFAEERIVEMLSLVERGERPVFAGVEAGEIKPLHRFLLRPRHQAYLKIAEGCDNRCAYCAIPLIRGHARSRDFESLVEEASAVSELGTKEIVIIAQDPTRFGLDTTGRYLLPELVSRVGEIPGLEWIRIMYAHPARADVLVQALTASRKVCRYADVPVQHSSRAVLSRMGRSGCGDEYLASLESIRARVPGISLRSTFMVGFPGETERDFEDLLAFIREAHFEHAGVFKFSPEEGTAAESLPERIAENVVAERHR